MKLEHAQAIVNHIKNEFGEEASVYINYSGRCMFGKMTTGVVAGSIGTIERAIGALGLDINSRSDNMGLDYIVY